MLSGQPLPLNFVAFPKWLLTLVVSRSVFQALMLLLDERAELLTLVVNSLQQYVLALCGGIASIPVHFHGNLPATET
jgi:hypothetical protein